MSAPSPYAEAVGIVVEDRGGAARLRLPFKPDLLGRPEFIHGGAIAGLLERAALAALRHALGEAAVRITLLTVTVDYMRGGNQVETWGQGRTLRIGRRIANLEASAWQASPDKPIAMARINFALERGGDGS